MASRLYGKSIRLERKGKPDEAIVMVLRTLQTVRKSGANIIGPHALSLTMTATTHLDKLADQIGRPEIAIDALKQALLLCKQVAIAEPKLISVVEPYRNWFNHRINLITAQQL